ncbi:MAG: hypothetical protein WAM04_09970 [Candidatus Sulfotelmatobacter sp.]
MSLIFDSFADVETAEAFRQTVERQFPGRLTRVWMDQDEMHKSDWRKRPGGEATAADFKIESDTFPFGLFPPIVLVWRKELPNWSDEDRENKLAAYSDVEREVKGLVVFFGGKFAGT